MSGSDKFERPDLEPIGNAYRLAYDWHTDCFGAVWPQITVKAGFVTDGASVPRLLWRVAGDPMEVPRIYAAIVHDWIYSGGDRRFDREEADCIYRDYNIALGMSKFRAYIEYYALRLFGGGHWES